MPIHYNTLGHSELVKLVRERDAEIVELLAKVADYQTITQLAGPGDLVKKQVQQEPKTWYQYLVLAYKAFGKSDTSSFCD